MTGVIFKYPLILADRQNIEMPRGATILTVQEQDGMICLWAQVDPQAPIAERRIAIVGTGHAVPDYAEYIGTVQPSGTRFVWHVFDMGDVA